jgi:hypothetical protein
MALASRGSIRVTVALWPAGYEMPRMKSVKKAQIPPPPPESPSARALAEIAELRALSRELLRLVYELDEYAARIRQSLAAEAELQSSLRSRPRNEMRTAEKVH